jgi:hypothetical protein
MKIMGGMGIQGSGRIQGSAELRIGSGIQYQVILSE